MSIKKFINKVPKVELHVHLEGSIKPTTLLKLALKNEIDLPAKSIEELEKWYQFVDFPHFAEIYQTISRCIKSSDDIELITRDFLENQASQNIIHTEATFTALAHYLNNRIDFDEQIKAINRAKKWGYKNFGVTLGIIVDIPRDYATADQSMLIAEWVSSCSRVDVIALGLGGYEVGFPPELFKSAFKYANSRGVPAVVHAGETGGPDSIWGAIRELGALRIGHGVRCIEDKKLMQVLKTEKIPLEICPSSNICLQVFDNINKHILPDLVDNNLIVTINSDDPPMFNTNLNTEFIKIHNTFNYSPVQIKNFIKTAALYSLVDEDYKKKLTNKIETECNDLILELDL